MHVVPAGIGELIADAFNYPSPSLRSFMEYAGTVRDRMVYVVAEVGRNPR